MRRNFRDPLEDWENCDQCRCGNRDPVVRRRGRTQILFNRSVLMPGASGFIVLMSGIHIRMAILVLWAMTMVSCRNDHFASAIANIRA